MSKNPLIITIVLIFTLMASISIAGNAEVAEDLFDEGLTFLRKGQHIRALARFDQAYELNPNWKYLEPAAKALASQNKTEEAIEKYELFLNKAGKDVSKQSKSNAERELSRLKTILKKEKYKEEAQAHYRKGTELQKSGELERAIIEFEKAYDLSGEYFIKRNIAVLELALGNGDAAVKEFKKYLKYGGDKISEEDQDIVNTQIAQIEAGKGAREDEVRAQKDIEKARKLIRSDDYEDAYEILEKSYKSYKYYETLRYIGTAAAGMKKFRRALHFYHGFLVVGGARIDSKTRTLVKKEIQTIEPIARQHEDLEKSVAIAAEANTLYENGEYMDALSKFEDAYRHGNNWKYLKPIAETCEKLDYYAKAKSSYEDYIEYGRAEISSEDRELLRGRIRKLNKHIENHDGTAKAKIVFQEGQALHKQANFDQSSRKFELAYNIDPRYGILYWYAEAEEKRNNYERAAALYEVYLEEGGGDVERKRRKSTESKIVELRELHRNQASETNTVSSPAQLENELTAMLDVPFGEEGELSMAQVDPAMMGDGQMMMDTDSHRRSGPKKKRVWTWVQLGVGGGLIGGAIACAIIAKSEQDKIDAACPGGDCPPGVDLEEAQKKEKTVQTLETIRTVGFVTGGVLLASSLVFFFVEPKFYKRDVAVVPAISDTYAGLFLNAKF